VDLVVTTRPLAVVEPEELPVRTPRTLPHVQISFPLQDQSGSPQQYRSRQGQAAAEAALVESHPKPPHPAHPKHPKLPRPTHPKLPQSSRRIRSRSIRHIRGCIRRCIRRRQSIRCIRSRSIRRIRRRASDAASPSAASEAAPVEPPHPKPCIRNRPVHPPHPEPPWSSRSKLHPLHPLHPEPRQPTHIRRCCSRPSANPRGWSNAEADAEATL